MAGGYVRESPQAHPTRATYNWAVETGMTPANPTARLVQEDNGAVISAWSSNPTVSGTRVLAGALAGSLLTVGVRYRLEWTWDSGGNTYPQALELTVPY